ncbi:DUF3137 domain-containing protein [Flavobacterium sp.]|uniref:DUF3137 domain-containing protein n=1 Tax=Flavobacterium sp. TaxID=239 RepID=UPI00375361C3
METNYIFDEKKFDALLNELESKRQEGATIINRNSKENRKDNFTMFFGFIGASVVGFIAFFVIMVIALLGCLFLTMVFDTPIFMFLVFIIAGILLVSGFLIPILLFRKKFMRVKTKQDENQVISKEYYFTIKEKIISEIIKSFNSSFEYNPKKAISRFDFEQMQVYDSTFLFSNGYSGEDYISGMVGNTQVEFCEFTTGRVSGLFMVANFNKNFKETTKVLTKVWKKTSLDIGGILDGTNFTETTGNYDQYQKNRNFYRTQKLEDVILENTMFNSLFDVYSSNQIEARYILSTALIERILNFKKRYNYDMNFVFIDSKMYFTINWGANMMEPYDISVSLKDVKLDLIKETHQELKHCIEIIDALNINNELWYSR